MRPVCKSVVILVVLLSARWLQEASLYAGEENPLRRYATVGAIPLPDGYTRVMVETRSFAEYLRQLPLKTDNNQVYLYNGDLKFNQAAHYRVVAMDVGNRNLQQCADAVIRLRAEYLFTIKQYDQIAFNFSSGDRAAFQQWAEGYRPDVTGNQVRWRKRAQPDASYRSFREYLDTVFMYAGSASLSQELQPVSDVQQIQIGNVFIHGGWPGHAVLVVDLACAETTQTTLMMLAQSYMPAQEIHILRNPASSDISPWYVVGDTGQLSTPEWTFDWTELKRFPAK